MGEPDCPRLAAMTAIDKVDERHNLQQDQRYRYRD